MLLFRAASDNEIREAEGLFREYAASLDFDLSFQDFDEEMTLFPRQYSLPTGCLLVAYENGTPVGCVGLRKLGERVCEMKRLYVRPKFRGHGIGKALAVQVIKEARSLRYERMRLDTVPSMRVAIGLYKSLGFREIEKYRENPIPGALFLELKLGRTTEA